MPIQNGITEEIVDGRFINKSSLVSLTKMNLPFNYFKE